MKKGGRGEGAHLSDIPSRPHSGLPMSQLQFNLMPDRRAFTVTELTAKIRDLFARNFTDIWVTGEISNCHEAQSGHIYCTLKDERAQVKCVCFKNQLRTMKFRPEDGLHVTVRGSISVYEARGEYQIYIEHIEPVGLGALQLAFEQLKKRLEAEGLFAADRKKPLPLLPSRIGLITSPRCAAAFAMCTSPFIPCASRAKARPPKSFAPCSSSIASGWSMC